MLERSDGIDQAVAGLRARRSPPPDAEARVLAGLELTLGGPPAGGGSAAASSGAGSIHAVWVAKVIAATVAMTAGGLSLVRAGVIVVGLAGDGKPPTRAEAREPTISASTSEPVEPEQPTSEPILRTPSAPILLTPSEPAIEREPKPESLATKPASAPPIHAANDLEAELALIRDARAQTDPQHALTRLDDHARTFPSGSLADEREALRVLALCKLDRLAQARTAARALVESRPSSPLLDRMREGCPVLASEFGE